MKIFVLGMLFWMFVCTIVTLIKDDEDLTTKISMGVFNWVINIVAWIFGKILLLYCKRFNCYKFFGKIEDKANPNRAHIHNYYLTAKNANHFRIFDEIPDGEDASYSIRLIREGKTFKSTIYWRDIVRAINKPPHGMSIGMWEKFKKKNIT